MKIGRKAVDENAMIPGQNPGKFVLKLSLTEKLPTHPLGSFYAAGAPGLILTL
jgi:hypothetical protein